jgi:hypothetical protein
MDSTTTRQSPKREALTSLPSLIMVGTLFRQDPAGTGNPVVAVLRIYRIRKLSADASRLWGPQLLFVIST